MSTIQQTQARIEATEAEIAQLQLRLSELATLPADPGPKASHKDRLAHRLEVSQLRSDRRPEVEGTEAALADLQADLQRERATLAQLQAQQTQQVREARVAAARARIDELGGELATAVATVKSLLTEIHQEIEGASEDHRLLQSNPHPLPTGTYDTYDPYYRWRPEPFDLGSYNDGALPTLYQEGSGYGTMAAGARHQSVQLAEKRQRELKDRFAPSTPTAA